MRLPSGTPVSPAMKTPPKNQADEGEAEKRLPLASAMLTHVVSRDPIPGLVGGATDETSLEFVAVESPELGSLATRSKRQGSPGRTRSLATRRSMSVLRSAAYAGERSPWAGTRAKSGSP